jgi:hypothetical protein
MLVQASHLPRRDSSLRSYLEQGIGFFADLRLLFTELVSKLRSIFILISEKNSREECPEQS